MRWEIIDSVATKICTFCHKWTKTTIGLCCLRTRQSVQHFAITRLYNLSHFPENRQNRQIQPHPKDLQLSEVKVDVHCWRGLEQLMMGLPRAPKSRPARPAVRLQPPKLKLIIKDIIQQWSRFETQRSRLTNWIDLALALKRRIINHICVRIISNLNCTLCRLYGWYFQRFLFGFLI